MNKKVIFGIVVFAVVVAVVLGLVVSHQIKNQQQNNQPPASLTVKTKEGDVQIKNYTAQPQQKPDLSTDLIDQTKDYSIVGFHDQNTFIITILSKPVSAARVAAEKAFLDDLGISRTDACKLQVSLSVPLSVDPNLAGKDYGLSFCLQGKAF